MAEAFGPAAFGAIQGRLTLVGTAARAAAPFALGVLVSAGVHDAVSLTLLATLTLGAAVAVAPLGRIASR